MFMAEYLDSFKKLFDWVFEKHVSSILSLKETLMLQKVSMLISFKELKRIIGVYEVGFEVDEVGFDKFFMRYFGSSSCYSALVNIFKFVQLQLDHLTVLNCQMVKLLLNGVLAWTRKFGSKTSQKKLLLVIASILSTLERIITIHTQFR